MEMWVIKNKETGQSIMSKVGKAERLIDRGTWDKVKVATEEDIRLRGKKRERSL